MKGRTLVAGMGTAVILLAGAIEGLPAPGASHELVSTIVFSSTRDTPNAATQMEIVNAGEIYLMDPDGTNPRRLTVNADGDGFAALSPDGKKIVFNSNRLRPAEGPFNTGDLFVMEADGSEEAHLIRGSSATWSPDSENIAFHASASGTGLPIKPDPGAATSDSDIFVMNVDDSLDGSPEPVNITNSPLAIDDDPDWSPNGQTIIFTTHLASDNPINSVTAEIVAINADGSGGPVPLTSNTEEERAPSWSHAGTRIVFMCRRGGPDFEICVMNADGTDQVQLTNNSALDATPTFSPDDQTIVFHRQVGPTLQIWEMNADGTGQTQMTSPPGFNTFANWGELRVHVPNH
jgi:Tol biopolymer transport system component